MNGQPYHGPVHDAIARGFDARAHDEMNGKPDQELAYPNPPALPIRAAKKVQKRSYDERSTSPSHSIQKTGNGVMALRAH